MLLFFFLLFQSSDHNGIQDRLKSENYTVTWGKVQNFDSSADLEIGEGSGHGFNLNWIRFHPAKDAVEVLKVDLDTSMPPYHSKWPPDRPKITVTRAKMKIEDYIALLRNLAVVESAQLQQVDRDSGGTTTRDFWVSAHLKNNQQTFMSLDWAGYWSSFNEVNFAKPQACVDLAQSATKRLQFERHSLTDEERKWAGQKFISDWKVFQKSDFFWFVRERYIISIGLVGDDSCLPLLRDIMCGEPNDRADIRSNYYAINAITRLIKKDVRDKPVEEMNIEGTRKRILELFKDKK